jgi:hypothetical protein
MTTSSTVVISRDVKQYNICEAVSGTPKSKYPLLFRSNTQVNTNQISSSHDSREGPQL